MLPEGLVDVIVAQHPAVLLESRRPGRRKGPLHRLAIPVTCQAPGRGIFTETRDDRIRNDKPDRLNHHPFPLSQAQPGRFAWR